MCKSTCSSHFSQQKKRSKERGLDFPPFTGSSASVLAISLWRHSPIRAPPSKHFFQGNLRDRRPSRRRRPIRCWGATPSFGRRVIPEPPKRVELRKVGRFRDPHLDAMIPPAAQRTAGVIAQHVLVSNQ